MADRVSASIIIGGSISSENVAALVEAIQAEDLSLEYDGEGFEAHEMVSGEPLMLCAHEVAWGTFNILEPFCRKHKLAYSRWFGACAGAWGSGRAIYRGIEETRPGEEGVDEYDTSDDDQIFLGEQLARHLGSYAAILDHFDRANFTVPPLEIVEPTGSRHRDAIAVPA
jgi:hypothetical protein